jgi:hypothetical protein
MSLDAAVGDELRRAAGGSCGHRTLLAESIGGPAGHTIYRVSETLTTGGAGEHPIVLRARQLADTLPALTQSPARTPMSKGQTCHATRLPNAMASNQKIIGTCGLAADTMARVRRR